MFQALADVLQCTINDVADILDLLCRSLYTAQEAGNGLALIPRVKQRQLHPLKKLEELPSSIEAFTQEYSTGQREMVFVHSFDYRQVPNGELKGAVVVPGYIKYTVPSVKILRRIFKETRDAIVR